MSGVPLAERRERVLAEKVSLAPIIIGGKRATGVQLFRMRMEHEGKLALYRLRIQELMQEYNWTPGKATKEARKHFGYRGLQHEKTLYIQRTMDQSREFQGIVSKELRAEAATRRADLSFEEALATLPDKADKAAQLDWIMAHPAMARQARQKDKAKPVIVTGDDIIGTSYKPAPSKAAVYQLQHWCNHPHVFYLQMLGEDKKKSGGNDGAGGPGSGFVEDDLSDIEQALAEFGQ